MTDLGTEEVYHLMWAAWVGATSVAAMWLGVSLGTAKDDADDKKE